MGRLYFASFLTLSLLFAMLAGVVIAGFVMTGALDLGTALVLTVGINLIIFLVSPWLTDLMLRWVHKVAFLDDATLAARHPHVHAIIHDVAKQYGFKAPSVGVIPDRNPTAFTYGLLRSNARIILTDGIFEFLTEDETRAVVAHELGHVVNRDFLVMTVAGTLVQMLYQISASLGRTKTSGKKNGGQLAIVAVAVAAYVLYLIGIYVLLYLSRTREYLADRFSAEHVEARHLANALVKIAYGIAEAADTEATRDLLASTRHLGVVDVKNARHLGLVAENTHAEPGAMANAMLFDVYNPWARWIELSSTHPLTGRRIMHLAAVATELNQGFPEIDIATAAQKAGLDEGKLRSKFIGEIAISLSPLLVGIAVALLGAWPLAPAAAAIAWLMTISWRYPGTTPEPVHVLDLMSDYAASPVRGRAVKLTGMPIGRADAGSIVGEDLIFEDETGRIVTDFRSMLGPIGNLFAGWKRVAKHIGAEGEITGWFRRSMGGYVIQRHLRTSAGDLDAYPQFWEIALALIVIAVSIVGALAWLESAPAPF